MADLGLAIVSVRFFAVARGLFRYGERLVGHDAAFRSLAELRVRVYERLERLAPTGLHSFHRGDLLARVVRDVDTLQDVGLRVLPAWWIAGVVGLATTVALWLLLPSAAIAVAVALLAAATVVPWLTGVLARRTEAKKAPARGALTASVVDLLEGAPDLVAFGATDAQVQRVMRHDDELTRAAASSARHRGRRRRAHLAVRRDGDLGRARARRRCGARRTARRRDARGRRADPSRRVRARGPASRRGAGARGRAAALPRGSQP